MAEAHNSQQKPDLARVFMSSCSSWRLPVTEEVFVQCFLEAYPDGNPNQPRAAHHIEQGSQTRQRTSAPLPGPLRR